ncbi:helix-turn-helix transcriptional regulator [Actinomadura sp. NBRC 104425]|uniref:AAA family ATPase n=1 Tax=Actinomadura sp. NBRC 104425 TaxID=3032204 RepID=UPI0024A2C49E|nr:LuxR family transcriptional regulator [Actinomadura sp. NBRC 104425]GLZ14071.1 helix-turn-helix transcriptional regulator [Actinomadura sp. NBRC 104425]
MTLGTDLAPTTTTAPLYGRDHELAALRGLLARARTGHGGALAIAGPPGIGRTALLEAVVRQAPPRFRAVGTRGIPQETAVPYAGLHRLLRPLVDAARRSSPAHASRHADVLAPLLGHGGGVTAAPFTLYTAVCGLLAEVAAGRPLLCWVDDAHLLDRVSLEALTYAARRVRDDRVAMVFTVCGRDGPADVPRLTVPPLDDAASMRLLDRLTRGLIREELAEELVELAAGRPLALVELAEALTPGQLAGTAAPPRALPAGSRLRARYRRRYLGLPPGARRLVLLAVADDRLDLDTLSRAAGLADLDAALGSGLLRVDGQAVEVPPLVRSSVYADASPAERRWVHARLADVLDQEGQRARRCRHRAAAVDRPDDSLADELADAAASARATGQYLDASRAWQRAAELTTGLDLKADRYVSAAADAWTAGLPRRARAMLRPVLPFADTPERLGRARLLQGEIELYDGTPAIAAGILREAADRLADSDPALAATTLMKAAHAAEAGGDLHSFAAIADHAAQLHARGPVAELVVAHLVGLAATFRGRFDVASRNLARALELADQTDDCTAVMYAAFAAMVCGDGRRARELAARAVASARCGAAPVLEPQALAILAHTELFLGRYPAATAIAREGLHLARAAGQRNIAADHLATIALVTAFRGDRAATLGHLDGLSDTVGRHGLARPAAYGSWALACLDLADDRPADALPRLRLLTGTDSAHPAVRVLATAHLVEAAARCGRRDEARRAFELYDRWARGTRSPGRRALAHRCHALLADDEDTAAAHFEEALRLHGHCDATFELARTELLYGHRLRRDRRPREARGHLRTAVQIFAGYDAAAWAERARAELRAAGEAVNGGGTAGLDRLTAQQLQIARLVAAGATNREIAARLTISPRTVDHHLRNVFSRLGIRSRVELARLLT